MGYLSGCLWQVPLVSGRSGEPDVMAQLVGTTAQRTLIDNNLRKECHDRGHIQRVQRRVSWRLTELLPRCGSF